MEWDTWMKPSGPVPETPMKVYRMGTLQKTPQGPVPETLMGKEGNTRSHSKEQRPSDSKCSRICSPESSSESLTVRHPPNGAGILGGSQV